MATIIDGGVYQFPDLNVPESKKNMEWHKDYVYAIVNRTLNASYDLDYLSVETCQEYYHGMQSNDEFGFLQYAEDGDVLPAFWINYNKIAPKINLLLGEIIKKSYKIDVKSINKGAKARKLESKESARVDLRLAPYAAQLESQFGMPLQQGQQFEDEDHLEDYFSHDYKERSEMVMRGALRWCFKRQKWDYERVALFRDVVISGRCFSKTELIDGIPKTRRIDPKYMVWDRDATDDFLTDATYFGEVRYMNIAEAAQKYDVTKEELIKVYNSQKYIANTSNPRKYEAQNSMLKDSSLTWFKQDEGELRILVFEAYWVDYKRLTNKISEDKYGNIHVKTLSDETKTKKNIQSNFYKIWRKGVLLGGDILKDWGETKNMPRSVDDPSDTGCPYKALIPNYINYGITSVVSLLKPLQDLKNIAMYKLQLAMARAGGKGFVYDTAQVPEGWDVHTVMKYLKTANIAFINSRQDDGLPAQFNQFQTIDLSLGEEVNKYLEISFMVDREMDAITGINEARQGIVQNASQAVGVTQSALVQSSLTTETYFEFFRQYSSDIMNYTAGLIKIAWPQYNDRFSAIIGDEGVDFLISDVELDLDDYAVFAEEVPASISDTQNLHRMVETAIQTGQINIVDGLKLLKETDIDRGILMLERAIKKAEKKAQKEQQRQEQMGMQMQQQQAEAQAQSEAEARQHETFLKEMDKNIKLSDTAAKGKIDITLEKMDNRAKKEIAEMNKQARPEKTE